MRAVAVVTNRDRLGDPEVADALKRILTALGEPLEDLNHGQSWSYTVNAYRVKDGSRYRFEDKDPLPHYAQFYN